MCIFRIFFIENQKTAKNGLKAIDIFAYFSYHFTILSAIIKGYKGAVR